MLQVIRRYGVARFQLPVTGLSLVGNLNFRSLLVLCTKRYKWFIASLANFEAPGLTLGPSPRGEGGPHQNVAGYQTVRGCPFPITGYRVVTGRQSQLSVTVGFM